MSGLDFRPTALADAASLAGTLIQGGGPLDLPTVGETDAVRREGRLPIEAFATSSTDLREKLARVLDGDGFVVSTGQQPVLFLGPMYVVYKALTAIALASSLEEKLGVPVVPVFWVASDDHDWVEIGQSSLPDPQGELQTLRIEAPVGRSDLPAGSSLLDESIAGAIDAIQQLLPQSEFTATHLNRVRDSYATGSRVGSAFIETLLDVLTGFDLAVLDSASPHLKRAARPLFERLFREPDVVMGAMEQGATDVREAGFEPAIAAMDDGLPVFFESDRRLRVIRGADGTFAAGRDGAPCALDEWIGRLDETPELFSPNVSSRPILESDLMPVAATVLGPGEIAYWSQLRPLFETLEVPFPAVVPRASFQIVEPRIRKTLGKLGLEPDDLSDGGASASARVTEEARPHQVAAALQALRESVSERSAELEGAVASELPGLNAAAGKTGKAVLDAIGQFDRKINSAVRERQETTLGQVSRAAGVLWPARRPQERVISPFYFLCRYGPAVVAGAGEAVERYVDGFLAGAPEAR